MNSLFEVISVVVVGWVWRSIPSAYSVSWGWYSSRLERGWSRSKIRAPLVQAALYRVRAMAEIAQIG